MGRPGDSRMGQLSGTRARLRVGRSIYLQLAPTKTRACASASNANHFRDIQQVCIGARAGNFRPANIWPRLLVFVTQQVADRAGDDGKEAYCGSRSAASRETTRRLAWCRLLLLGAPMARSELAGRQIMVIALRVGKTLTHEHQIFALEARQTQPMRNTADGQRREPNQWNKGALANHLCLAGLVVWLDEPAAAVCSNDNKWLKASVSSSSLWLQQASLYRRSLPL